MCVCSEFIHVLLGSHCGSVGGAFMSGSVMHACGVRGGVCVVCVCVHALVCACVAMLLWYSLVCTVLSYVGVTSAV